MYAIIERTNGKSRLISLVGDSDNFIEYIKDRIATDILVVNLSSHAELKDDKYIDALYLINYNNEKAFTVKKQTTVEVGYIYNTCKTELIPLSEFELIENCVNCVDTTKTITNGASFKYFKPLRLDSSTMDKYYSTLMLGHRGAGTSTAVASLVDKLDANLLENMLVISGSEYQTNFYTSRYPKSTIIKKYNEKIVAQFLNDTPGIVVIDGTLPKNRYSKTFQNLIHHHRNMHKYFICSAQSTAHIFKSYRNNFDYTMIFRTDFYVTLKSYYADYETLFLEFENFRKFFKNNIKNYDILVIKNKISDLDKSNKILIYNSSWLFVLFNIVNNKN